MRLRVLVAAIAMFAASLTAHADPFSLTFTPTTGSVISLTPTSATPDFSTPDTSLTYVGFAANGDAVGFTFTNPVAFASVGFGDLTLVIFNSTSNLTYALQGMKLYAGPENAPSFTPGTYLLNASESPALSTLTGYGIGGTLDITATAATPEPASLALVATGMLGVAGAVRRRFTAA